MKNLWTCLWIGTGVALSLMSAHSAARPVEVHNSIEMTRIVDPGASLGQGRMLAKSSPNGRRFFVVTRSGDIASDVNRYRILVFGTETGSFRGLAQIGALEVASAGNDPGIADAHWVDDRHIAFLGAYAALAPQVYLWDTASSAAVPLTSAEDGGIAAFSATESGGVLYATSISAYSDTQIAAMRASGFAVNGASFWDLWARVPPPSAAPGRYRLLFKPVSGKATAATLLAELPLTLGCCFSVSPDGRYAVVAETPASIPALWKQYTQEGLHRIIRSLQPLDAATLSSPKAGEPLSQLVLFDLQSGTHRTLLDAPLGLVSPAVLWLKSRNSVVVSDVMLPIGTLAASADDSLTNSAIVEVNLQSGAVTPLLLLKSSLGSVVALSWDERHGVLTLQRSRNGFDPAPPLQLKAEARAWTRLEASDRASSSESAPTVGKVSVEVRQALNTAPDLFAVETGTRRTRRLTNLNPQFADLEFGKVVEISWHDRDGRRRGGGLVYPAHYEPGKRYPLVVQTHGFNRNAFLIDGPFDMYTGFGAQALANRGFAVAQVGGPGEDAFRSWATAKEGPMEMGSLLELIGQLDRAGLIDPSKIGLQGFSRSSYHVKYTLAFSGMHFAAASVADGTDYGYLQSLEDGGQRPDTAGIYDGALPVGAGLETYLRQAPDFQASNIDTPLRSEAIGGPGSVYGEWELYALLRMRHVPTEMFFYPDGVHELQKPQEEFNSQSGNVDWFDFWINGHEDPSAEKQEQYQRWRELRRLQRAQSFSGAEPKAVRPIPQ